MSEWEEDIAKDVPGTIRNRGGGEIFPAYMYTNSGKLRTKCVERERVGQPVTTLSWAMGKQGSRLG